MAETVDEDACLRCGRCCTLKIKLGPVVLDTRLRCPYLDPKTRLCVVYERRREVPHCASVEVALSQGVLPRGCPYTVGVVGYRPPVRPIP